MSTVVAAADSCDATPAAAIAEQVLDRELGQRASDQRQSDIVSSFNRRT
jgi:hypothetical protein